MKRFLTAGLFLLLAASLLVPAAMAKSKPKLVLATTTSTMDSGLLDLLVPIFERENGCQVQIIAVGTGAAIRYGRDGNADIVMVHDPAAEEKVVMEGFFVDRRYLMYNDFVMVGPAGDPAGIKGQSSAAEALKGIQTAQAVFVSRADQSGTHKKEQRLWAAAGLTPKGSWYLEAGAGMEAVLRIANEKRAYCLTDRGTYLAHQKEYELPILLEGDKELFNPYHVMLVAPAKHPYVNYRLARKFSEFLLSKRGQDLIAGFGVDKFGQPLFYPAAAAGGGSEMKRPALAVLLVLCGIATASAFEVVKIDKQGFPKVRVTGWVQAIYENTVYHDEGKVLPSGFSVKDAALMVQGDAWESTGFRIYLQGNRKNKVSDKADAYLKTGESVYSPKLLDAYVDWKPSPLYSFRLGQYKKQFGLEQGTSPVDLDFIYESMTTKGFLDNNRDQGIMAFGKWRDINYWLSLHNGASYNLNDKNWAKDVTARTVYALPWPGLSLGASAEYGMADGAARGLYRRRAGLEANWEWRRMFVRGEFMIGRDDKPVSDSLARTTSRTVTDTLVSWSYDSLSAAWVPAVTFSNRTVTTKTWTKKSKVDQALARGGYLTVGYVAMPRLRLAARGEVFRNDCYWKLNAAGTDTSWVEAEARTVAWNLGADYFLNKVTKLTVNYDIKQEDKALPLIKNNVLTAMVQAKF